MKSRVLLIAISLFVGLIAALGIAVYIKNIESKFEKDNEKIKVYVASEDLAKDSDTDSIISLVEPKIIPRSYIAQNAILSISQIKNKVLTINVSKGDQLTESMFSSAEKTGIVSEIPDGKRAISIEVDETNGVSKMIRKGNMVDIIASFEDDVSEKETSKVIIQNALIINGFSKNKENKGVFSSSNQSGNAIKKDTVIVGVSLTDAEKLVFAKAHGKVWLALRPSKNESTINTSVQNIDTVLR